MSAAEGRAQQAVLLTAGAAQGVTRQPSLTSHRARVLLAVPSADLVPRAASGQALWLRALIPKPFAGSRHGLASQASSYLCFLLPSLGSGPPGQYRLKLGSQGSRLVSSHPSCQSWSSLIQRTSP